MENNLMVQATQGISSLLLTPIKTSNTVSIFRSAILESKKISEATFDEIKASYTQCMWLVGIRPTTLSLFQDADKQLLAEYIRTTYGSHTLAEFVLAFKKAVAGELGLKDVNAYENFSPEYIGKIMAAYRRWAGDFYRETSIEQELITKEIEKKRLPPPAWHPIDLVEVYFQDFLAENLKIEFIPAFVWDQTMRIFNVAVATDLKEAILAEAREFMLAEYQSALKRLKNERTALTGNEIPRLGELKTTEFALERLKSSDLYDSCLDEKVNRRCKAITLQRWFYELRIAGITTLKDARLIHWLELPNRSVMVGFIGLRLCKVPKAAAEATIIDYKSNQYLDKLNLDKVEDKSLLTRIKELEIENARLNIVVQGRAAAKK